MARVLIDVLPPLAMIALNGAVTAALLRRGADVPRRPAVVALAAAPVVYGVGVLLGLARGSPVEPWLPGLALAGAGTLAVPAALAATVVPAWAARGLALAAAAVWLLAWVGRLRPGGWTQRASELLIAADVTLAGGAALAAIVRGGADGRERRAVLVALPLLAVAAAWALLKAPDSRRPLFSIALLVAAELAVLVLAADRLRLEAPATQRTRAVQGLLLALGALLLLVVAMNVGLFPREVGPALVAVAVATGMATAYAGLRPRLDAWLTGALYPEAAAAERRAAALQAELDATRERLRDAEHLALVGQLAAQVAHEIKNPLGPIKGYARIIERELERQGTTSEVVARGIAVIREEVEVIDGRARGLLALARPPAPRLEALDVGRVVADVVALVEGDRPEGTALRFAPPGGEAPAESDRLLLRSALTNVVQNALQACGGRGAVDVALAADGDDAWRVTVDDDGPGLPPGQDPEALFRPFAGGRPGGHGLGLVIARGALRALGGELTLGPRPASAPGAAGPGARATLRVPRRAAAAPGAEATAPAGAAAPAPAEPTAATATAAAAAPAPAEPVAAGGAA